MTVQNVAVLVIAVLVVGFLGAFLLLYPNDPKSFLAIGTLATIAGGVGTFFFHSSQQTFLGTQLAAQPGDNGRQRYFWQRQHDLDLYDADTADQLAGDDPALYP